MIEVRDLVKVYPVPGLWAALRADRLDRPARGMRALDGISLRVEEGEVMGLLGANGAGKTTLLHILSTLIEPTSGTISVGGFDLAREPQRARMQIGLVTSNERSFYWRLSGRENLRFFAELFRVPAARARARIDELVAALDLEEFADRRFDRYSTGIRQRFAFGRALLHEPSVLLMDEPSKGLDPRASDALIELIHERILRHWKPTLLIASHNLAEVEALCERVAILDRGRIVSAGEPRELARALRAHQTYRVELRGADRTKLAEGLAARLGAEHVRIQEGATLRLELDIRDPGRELTAALRCILDQGAELLRCEPQALSLDDVFRETLSRRSPRGDAP